MMNELLSVMLITLLAVISPGADFAIVSRYSGIYGRATGIYTALGIAAGVLVHVSYCLAALLLMSAYTPVVIEVLKYLGAVYLIYIGWQTFTQPLVPESQAAGAIKYSGAWMTGFITNVLNPKTMLFVVSTYTQIVEESTALKTLLFYGGFMSFAHLLWFALVALIFSAAVMREKMLKHQRYINRFTGTLLTLLGLLLLGTNF